MTLGALVVIGLGMTILVYGAVALLVKIDDIGLRLMESPSLALRHTGARVVKAMPEVFRAISIVGTVAMLWVGGHLVIANLAETVWHGPYDLLHAVALAIEATGPVIVWIVDTAMSAIFGLVLGLLVVAVTMGIARLRARKRGASAAH
jgi:predicted DNA repair protein MutK